MEAILHVPTSDVSLSQLAQLIREQLPATDREQLAALIRSEDAPPTKEQLLNQLKEDYIALQKGTLKTRPAAEFLAELERDNLL
jgi:hypothetical protein